MQSSRSTKCGPGFGPEHIVAVAVAVDAQVPQRARVLESRLDEIQQLPRHLLVTMADVIGDAIAGKQIFDRLASHGLRRKPRPMLEPARRADGVDATEEATDPLAVVLGSKLRPLPAAARVDREPESAEDRHGPFAELSSRRQVERRDDGYLRRRQLARERVLLGDRQVSPSPRPVELHDDRIGVLDDPPGIRGFRSFRARESCRRSEILRLRPHRRSNLVTGSQTGPIRPLVSCRHDIVELR